MSRLLGALALSAVLVFGIGTTGCGKKKNTAGKGSSGGTSGPSGTTHTGKTEATEATEPTGKKTERTEPTGKKTEKTDLEIPPPPDTKKTTVKGVTKTTEIKPAETKKTTAKEGAACPEILPDRGLLLTLLAVPGDHSLACRLVTREAVLREQRRG